MAETRLGSASPCTPPPSKRPRLSGPGFPQVGQPQLDELYQLALTGCLCQLNVQQPADQLLAAQLDSSDRGRQLLALSSLQLAQQAAHQQLQLGSMCGRLQQLASQPPAEQLLRLLSADQPLLSCGAGRCLTLSCLLLPTERAQHLLETLVSAVLDSDSQLEVSNGLNALQRLIEQHDDESSGQPQQQQQRRPLPASCTSAVSVSLDSEALTEIKCCITALLETRWVPFTQRFCQVLVLPAHETEVLAFLHLWTTLVSVRNNLSIAETKSFYGRLEGLISALTAETSPHVWRAVLDLYCELLCYGSTIALQDCVAEEPASLAHALLRHTRAGRLLELVPYQQGVRSFGGRAGDQLGDRPLLQKTVLLLLKALAVTVKETRCESSSDSSARSAGGSGSEEQDLAIIERTLRDVVRRLDTWIKTHLPFHPAAPLSEWSVILMCDQDDYLVEAMLCLLDLSSGLCGRVQLQPDFQRAIDPHRSFVQFLDTVRLDHDLLLDLLVSNETCFLLYLLRYLKHVRRHWQPFAAACAGRLDEVMSVLIRLRFSLDRLVARNLFPYNVTPILRLLERLEELYEDHAPPT